MGELRVVLRVLDGRGQDCYVAFGDAQGLVRGGLVDAHGAGALRSDPKAGRPEDYPQYFGPQGDLRRVFNHVRCVRDASAPND